MRIPDYVYLILVILLAAISSSVGIYALTTLPKTPELDFARDYILAAVIMGIVSIVLIATFMVVYHMDAGGETMSDLAGFGAVAAGFLFLANAIIYGIAATQLKDNRVSMIIGTSSSLLALASYMYVGMRD